jgi:thioredoxin-dependent peroxiredoxin
MKIIIGDSLEEIILPSINNKEFNTSSLLGKKILLTFYRFARCPMCNLRINELLKSSKNFVKTLKLLAYFILKLKT